MFVCNGVVMLYCIDFNSNIFYCTVRLTVMITVMFTDMRTVKCTVMCTVRSGQVSYPNQWAAKRQCSGPSLFFMVGSERAFPLSCSCIVHVWGIAMGREREGVRLKRRGRRFPQPKCLNRVHLNPIVNTNLSVCPCMCQVCAVWKYIKN